MRDRFGYGAIVRAMRPEEREEMLALLLEAVAGEMPAASGAERQAPAGASADAETRARGAVRRWDGTFGAHSARLVGMLCKQAR